MGRASSGKAYRGGMELCSSWRRSGEAGVLVLDDGRAKVTTEDE